MNCPTCHGTRTVTTRVPNVKRSNGLDYVSSIQPTKVRVDVCETCNYTGTVDDLDPIWQRTAAASLIDSDRANAD